MHTSCRYYVCAISLLALRALPGYCVEVHGLKLELISSLANDMRDSRVDSHADAAITIEHLDDLLTEKRFSFKNSSSEIIDINLDASVGQFSDTDDERLPEYVRKLQRKSISRDAQKIGGYNASRNPPYRKQRSTHSEPVAKRPKYSEENNYLKKEELKVAEESFVIRENLCIKLANDALDIASQHPSVYTRDAMTCFCVVLIDKHRHAKKFVFHNQKDSLPEAISDRAEELGYDIINAEQAHAEGEFMQFLLRQKQEAPNRYTHILGMGCSRLHCSECDLLFKILLGQDYHNFTASMCVVAKSKNLPTVERHQGGSISIAGHYKNTYNAVGKTDAFKKEYAQNYYLPDYLKKALSVLFQLSELKFVDRFTRKSSLAEE
jgi:hypothetical protein